MPSNCLIVIDMQNDFLDKLEEVCRARLISKTNQLIGRFRAASYPVIWVQQLFSPDLSDAFLEMRGRRISVVIEGTEGAELDSKLARESEDPIIIKKRYSAFFDTNLEEILRNLTPNKITLAGVNTHACIRTTAIDAYQRDIPVLLASECIDSNDPKHAQMSMTYMDGKIAVAMTNDEIAAAIT